MDHVCLSLVKQVADARRQETLHQANMRRLCRQTERTMLRRLTWRLRQLLGQAGHLLIVLGRRLQHYDQPQINSPQSSTPDMLF
jgi:hypothetical protein